MDFKYVAFDMDGTLTDTMKYWRNIVPNYVEMKGLDKVEISDDIYEQSNNMTVYNGLQFLKDNINNEIINNIGDAETFETMEYCYINKTELRPGVKDYLDRLKANNARLCCISATPTRLVKIALEKVNILDYFDFILSPDEYPNGKATADIFFGAAQRFGCNVTDLALFDDAYYSLNTAKSIGIYCVGIKEKYEECNLERIKQITDEFYNEFTEIT